MSSDARSCRVLTHCTINGRAYIAGERVELAEPQRGFLIEHRRVKMELEQKRAKAAKKKRGEVDSGAPV